MRQTIDWLLALPAEERTRMEEARNYTFTRLDPAPKQAPVASPGQGTNCVLNVGCTEALELICEFGARPAMLNFAHGYNCGGGFEHAGGSQEEAIFRASSCFLSLWPHRRSDDGPGVLKRGRWIGEYDEVLPRKDPFYQHTECGGIYSPHVRLVRNCKSRDGPLLEAAGVESLHMFGLLSIAAQDVNFDGRFEEDLLREKARTALHIAASNGHDVIILGAFGCGYFRNPPQTVAQVFKELLEGEFAGVFSLVVFSIPDRRGSNLTEFTSRFDEFSCKKLEELLKTYTPPAAAPVVSASSGEQSAAAADDSADAKKVELPRTSSESAAAIVTLFKLFDANANGVLEKSELQEVLAILDPHFTRDKFEYLIELADLDRNGTIDLQEFLIWLWGSDLDTDEFRQAVRELENPTSAWAKAYKRSLEMEAERVRRKAQNEKAAASADVEQKVS